MSEPIWRLALKARLKPAWRTWRSPTKASTSPVLFCVMMIAA